MPNKDGLTPAKIASNNEHIMIFMFLKKQGAAWISHVNLLSDQRINPFVIIMFGGLLSTYFQYAEIVQI